MRDRWGWSLPLLHSYNLTYLIYEALRHTDAHAVTGGSVSYALPFLTMLPALYTRLYDVQTLMQLLGGALTLLHSGTTMV